MNYFLENYISPLIKDQLNERSLRSVRKRMEFEMLKNTY